MSLSLTKGFLKTFLHLAFGMTVCTSRKSNIKCLFVCVQGRPEDFFRR
uniref:Uncharacterized protein n=1 Tax=Anguilla anguilla TaxID=7936 RepID=A0A0E9URJ5_ANGAN